MSGSKVVERVHVLSVNSHGVEQEYEKESNNTYSYIDRGRVN
jgi:hypothetical protein